MRKAKFNLLDLEAMHSNLPSLKILCLDFAYPMSGEMPQDVVPASLITELEVKIEQAENRHAHIQFYKYITHKYTSVDNPILDDNIEISIGGTDNIPHIYNEGIFPLYQKIGSKVDTFIFSDYFNGLDAFRKFDDYGMKLKDLTIKMAWIFANDPFIEELAQSQQSKYIQKLILFDILPHSIHMISQLEVLDTLDISGGFCYDINGQVMRKELNLNQLIHACPATLTTLIAYNINLSYDGPASTITNIDACR